MKWLPTTRRLRSFFLNHKKNIGLDTVEYENQVFVRLFAQIHEPWFQIAIAEQMANAKVFVDVGSADGLYTVLAQNYLRGDATIIGIDPRDKARSNFEKLTKEGSHPSKKSQFYQVALSDRSGTDFIRKDTLCKNIPQKNQRHDPIAVKTMTLDYLMLDQLNMYPDLIKIDVEGWEYTLLKGCKRIIDQCQSQFFLEIHWNYVATSGCSGHDVLNLFDDERYSKELIYFANGQPFLQTDGQGQYTQQSKYRKTALSYYHIFPKAQHCRGSLK